MEYQWRLERKHCKRTVRTATTANDYTRGARPGPRFSMRLAHSFSFRSTPFPSISWGTRVCARQISRIRSYTHLRSGLPARGISKGDKRTRVLLRNARGMTRDSDTSTLPSIETVRPPTNISSIVPFFQSVLRLFNVSWRRCRHGNRNVNALVDMKRIVFFATR